MKTSKIIKGILLTIGLIFLSSATMAATADEYAIGSIINVPTDYTSIQVAIDAASSGDVVIVSAGTYNESITMKDGVSVIGSGPNSTTIDAGGNTYVVRCINIGNQTIISGFTLTNGLLGIWCTNSSPVITNNYISNIDFSQTSGPPIYGHGILIDDSSPKIFRNVIFKVGGEGILADGDSEPEIINNTIFNYRYYAGISFVSETMGEVFPIIKNNIVYRGNSETAGGVVWNGRPNRVTPSISYNDVFDPGDVGLGLPDYYYYYIDDGGWNNGSGGTGAIQLDPLFVNESTGDLHLKSSPTSPCINAGDPDPIYNDYSEDCISITIIGDCNANPSCLWVFSGDPTDPGHCENDPGSTRNDMGAYGGPADMDGDWVANNSDNCPFTPNPGQENFDGDEIGDACEDTDSDGMLDFWELAYGLDPYNPSDAYGDLDGDWLPNVDEFYNGTNPNNPDTDGDKISDSYEITYARDPNDPNDTPDIPLNAGSVMNVHEPDGSFSTYLEVEIGQHFIGTLSDDITGISIAGHSGPVPTYPGPEWTHFPQWRSFFIALSGSPIPGPYTFTVESDLLTGEITDTQGTLYTIPIPDTFSPSGGSTLSSKTPTFSWGSVTHPDPVVTIHYRLVIDENNSGDVGQRVFATSRVADMLEFTVPNNVLNPGQSYFWRVRAVDASNWVDVNNRAQSNRVPFTVERDPKRLEWISVATYNGTLYPEFKVLPGFRDKLLSATLTIPNAGRTGYPTIAYDLVADRRIFDNECRYNDFWGHNLDPVQPGDYGEYTWTLNFSDGAQEIYTETLEAAAVTGASITEVFFFDDGGVDVSWDIEPTEDNYYQVRVRDFDNKEYSRIGTWLNADYAYLSPWDLRCLEKGDTYRWLVRAWDDLWPNSNTAVTVEQNVAYSPASLIHTSGANARAWRGDLALEFTVRPGSRPGSTTELLGASVTGPDSFSYLFDLTNDWYDISTETRLGVKGWWPTFALTVDSYGTYIFTFDYSDGSHEIRQATLNDEDVTAVDFNTMTAEIHDSGGITFNWDLPGGVTDQLYQARIRSADGSKEYFKSDDFTDGTQVYASFWDLRGMEHGQTYQWFVRAFYPGYKTMEQSDPQFFVYNPFDAEGDGIFDLYDDDDDNDGVADVDDSDPLDPNVCGDTDGDTCEDCLNGSFDPDNDGTDTDYDGVCDAGDDDDDNDGLPDIVEDNSGEYNGPGDPGTDPLDPDSDGDGICDGAEVNIYHTNPLSYDSDHDVDTDGDGLSDGEEINVYGTEPDNPDSDGDDVWDGEDAFPLEITEWADVDGDGVGDNLADNCPNDFNEKSDWTDINGAPHTDEQPDFDLDGKGDVCDEDADNDTYISLLFPEGNDCDDLDPNIYPGDGTCEDVGLKGRPPKNNEPPDTDGDTIDDTDDNCPSIANTDQSDRENNEIGDGIGDVCDNCPDLINPDQQIPVYYKDIDGDGYSDGETLTQCSQPVNYISGPTAFDCDDSDPAVNPDPETTEIANNGIDDDCDPGTPDIVEDYTFVPVLQGASYDDWLPIDGQQVVVDFIVKGPDGNEVPGVSISLTPGPVTSYPGKYINDSNQAGPDFDVNVSGPNQVTLIPRDYGGSIVIHAEATVTTGDGTQVPLQKDVRFPKDIDSDGMADAWESIRGLDLTVDDSNSDPDGDGLTNFKEYRGVIWGRLNSVAPNGIYETVAFIPDNLVTHIRTDPNRRDLFVQFIGFDAAHPFAIGEAYQNAGIDVYALNAAVVAQENLSHDFNIDVVMVTLANTTFGFESGHIIKRGVADYTFATLGLSSFGNFEAYGTNCTIYKTSVDYYFSDRPYIDGTTLIPGGNMRHQEDWIEKDYNLNPINRIEDKDDDGKKDGGEDKSGNGILDGDHIARAPAGSADPWEFNHDLSPFNIDNDSNPVLVELPVADTDSEFTRAQVIKHVVTHEIGHNVGINIHTEDPLCVMYKFSLDWLRDTTFSNAAQELIMIHNF